MQYIHPSCYIVAMCHIYTANLYYSMKIRLQTSGYIEYNYSERYWFHDSIMSKTQNILRGHLVKLHARVEIALVYAPHLLLAI